MERFETVPPSDALRSLVPEHRYRKQITPYPHPQCQSEVSAWASATGGRGVPVFDPAPAHQDYQPEIPDGITSATILQKIRAPYDGHERQLARFRRRLRHEVETGPETPNEPPDPPDTTPPKTYPSLLGTLTFPEIWARTRKYAAATLQFSYQVQPADVDDGLQAGYLKLWQQLQQQPDLLSDKSLAWIGKGIIYTALHATRSDLQFQRHTTAYGEQELERASSHLKAHFRAHSRETREVDIRVDLHRAIRKIADQIMVERGKKRRDYDLWALYGLTMLQVNTNELSQMMGSRKQSVQAAYTRIRAAFKEILPEYIPRGAHPPIYHRARSTLPEQDLKTIRKINGNVSDAMYEAVRVLIETMQANTLPQDLLALMGIREKIGPQAQARTYGLPGWKMQRAYDRVHLMIAAQQDPTVRIRRPEHRNKTVFTLTDTTAYAVEQVALKLLKQPKSDEKLVALYVCICNLPISRTAKQFNIPISTLRYYALQVREQLGVFAQYLTNDKE